MWIEMQDRDCVKIAGMGRGPRGPCGLKSIYADAIEEMKESRPARALWIEIKSIQSLAPSVRKSRPARALWIEICLISIW